MSCASERFKDQKLLHRKYVVKILLAALKIFQASPNMIPIETKDIPVRRPSHSFRLIITLTWTARIDIQSAR